jgi:hypothetical protein
MAEPNEYQEALLDASVTARRLVEVMSTLGQQATIKGHHDLARLAFAAAERAQDLISCVDGTLRKERAPRYSYT